MRALPILLGAAAIGGGIYLYSKNKKTDATTGDAKTPVKGGGVTVKPGEVPMDIAGAGGKVDPAAIANALAKNVVSAELRPTIDNMLATVIEHSSSDQGTDLLLRGVTPAEGSTVNGEDYLLGKVNGAVAAGAYAFISPDVVGAAQAGQGAPQPTRVRLINAAANPEAVKDAILSGYWLYKKPA